MIPINTSAISISKYDLFNLFFLISPDFNYQASQKQGFLICLWCRRIIHDSQGCKNTVCSIDQSCDMGILSKYVLSPFWLSKNEQPNSRLVEDQTTSLRKHLTYTARPPQRCDSELEIMIIFISSNCGSHVGTKLYHCFLKYFNCRQIFLLPESRPDDV